MEREITLELLGKKYNIAGRFFFSDELSSDPTDVEIKKGIIGRVEKKHGMRTWEFDGKHFRWFPMFTSKDTKDSFDTIYQIVGKLAVIDFLYKKSEIPIVHYVVKDYLDAHEHDIFEAENFRAGNKAITKFLLSKGYDVAFERNPSVMDFVVLDKKMLNDNRKFKRMK